MEFYNLKAQQNKTKITNLFPTFQFEEEFPHPTSMNSFMHNMILKK